MPIRNRRTTYYVVLLVGTTAIFTITYNIGMLVWEGRPQPVYRSLEIVIQSFTTTGYGEDAPWQSPQMHLLVIAMQFAGIGLILTAADVFAVPWLRDTLTPSAPSTIQNLEDHVILCGYSSRIEAFIDELDPRGYEYVLVEPDPATAQALHQAGIRVILGDPESIESLGNARIDSARAIVADADDHTSASIVLAARNVAPEIHIATLLEDADLERYHRAAGADTVLSPRQLLGERLVAEIPTVASTVVDDEIDIGDDFELIELTVAGESELCDQTFEEARLGERFGVDVIGAWFDGQFESPIEPARQLRGGTRLLAAGEVDQVEALRSVTRSRVRSVSAQRIILAGFGDSGQAAYHALARARASVTILDTDGKEHVDIVGDARSPEVLREAGIDEASTLILTVGDDTSAIFTTLIAREMNPDLNIVVRANEEQDTTKLYRAGATFAQSLATVSARMLVSTVFEDTEVLAYDTQIRVVRMSAPGLEGRTLVDAAVRSITGSTIVAVIRGDETITDVDPSTFVFEPDDELIVVGTDDNITQFDRQFGEE